MKKSSVSDFLDRRIRQSMVDGFPIACIKQDIETRYKNMSKSLSKDLTEFQFEELLKGDLDNIKSSRVKYTAFYVFHARKRIEDLNWMLIYKSRFPKLSNSQIFNLIKLKEKLLPTIDPKIFNEEFIFRIEKLESNDFNVPYDPR